jgi:5-methylcytosine-specific restriction enzyme subunit McrC
LNALYNAFDDVDLDHERKFLDDPLVTGEQPLPTLRAYYRDALNVASVVVAQEAVLLESFTGRLRLPSLVLDMNDVFESYIRAVLWLHAKQNQWQGDVLDGNIDGRKLLFEALPSDDATPDVVLRAPDGTVPLVIEVKNVPAKRLSAREAINQAVTYAVSYKSPRVMVVHPRSTVASPYGMMKMGDIGEIEVYQYQMDLGSSDPAAEDGKFGEAVASLLPPSFLASATS